VQRSDAQEAEWSELLASARCCSTSTGPMRERAARTRTSAALGASVQLGRREWIKRLGFARRAVFLQVTNAAGIHAVPLAEFRGIRDAVLRQADAAGACRSRTTVAGALCGDRLRGRTLGIIGLGQVGREIARVSKALACG